MEQLDRQFLHAWQLGFHHPENGEELCFRAALPPELEQIVAYLEKKYATLDAEGPGLPDVWPR